MAGHIRNLKGTVDILPDQSGTWHFIENAIRDLMHRFAYREMRTPVFERTELFARGIGQSTDIVAKEMYTFVDKGQKSLTLKPEMTAPIMRAYLQHNLGANTPLTKVYYISPMFRQENPQAGRQRQFHQFGAEAIGALSPELDAEMIALPMQLLTELGIAKVQLKINTVGLPAERDEYKKELVKLLEPRTEELCQSCQARLNTNPLRILDCKNPDCREITKDVPSMIDFFGDESVAHYNAVKSVLDDLNIAYTEDSRLVRGLDYYSHTVFEIASGELGAQDAICGGGRYDLLADELGGRNVKAVGFAGGMERLLMVLDKAGGTNEMVQHPDVFFVALGAKARRKTQTFLQQLRARNMVADTDYLARSLKAQMREANRQNAATVVILGDDELERGIAAVKNMRNSEQADVALTDLVSHLLQQRG
jgi:histidyl-tRNA synthetase